MIYTQKASHTSRHAIRHFQYTLPYYVDPVLEAAIEAVSSLLPVPAPHTANPNLQRFQAHVLAHVGAPQLTGLSVVQRQAKFYYQVFPGLFTGRLDGTSSVYMEYQVFLALLETLRDPHYGTTPEARIDPWQLTPAARKGSEAKLRPLPFRSEREILEYQENYYISSTALQAIQDVVQSAPPTLVYSPQVFNMVAWTALRQHAVDKRTIKGMGRHRTPEVPLDQRPVVNGRRARGYAWTEEENSILRRLLNGDMRQQILLARRERREQARRTKTPWDEGKERAQDEAFLWNRVYAALPKRPKPSIKTRVAQMNANIKKSLMVDGFLPAARLPEYRLLSLGVRNALPRFRPRLHGPYIPVKRGAPVREAFPPHHADVLPWSEEDDLKVISLMKRNLNEGEFHAVVLDLFHGFRTDDLVLERARSLKKQGFLFSAIPQVTQRRGRPDRATLATRAQLTAIASPEPLQTEPASSEGPHT